MGLIATVPCGNECNPRLEPCILPSGVTVRLPHITARRQGEVYINCGRIRAMSSGALRRQWLEELICEQNELCALCDTPFRDDDPATLDHIKTLSAGGGDIKHNLQAAHWTCNNRRAGLTNRRHSRMYE